MTPPLTPEQLANRECGICGVRDIPRDVEWPCWRNGRPVHLACALKRALSELQP